MFVVLLEHVFLGKLNNTHLDESEFFMPDFFPFFVIVQIQIVIQKIFPLHLLLYNLNINSSNEPECLEFFYLYLKTSIKAQIRLTSILGNIDVLYSKIVKNVA